MASLTISILFIALQTTFNFGDASPVGVKMPQTCADKNFCFNDDGYPREAVDHLLRDLNSLSVDPSTMNTTTTTADRFADDDEFLKICPYESKSEPIYFIIDTNNDVRVVVQSSDRFQQIIDMSTCLTPGYTTPQDIPDMTFRCQQLELEYNFVVLTKDLSDLELAKPKKGLPVTCACRFHKFNPQ